MTNLVYLYDLIFFTVMLTAGVLAWRSKYFRRGFGCNRRRRVATGVGSVLASFFLIHFWAQIRPLPILVEYRRPMTETEKAQYLAGGIPTNILATFNMVDYLPFNGTNAPGITSADVQMMKNVLAWDGLLPLMPKRLHLTQDDWRRAAAYYKLRGLNEKVVTFHQSTTGEWKIRSIDIHRWCGMEPTNTWEQFCAWMPIDFK